MFKRDEADLLWSTNITLMEASHTFRTHSRLRIGHTSTGAGTHSRFELACMSARSLSCGGSAAVAAPRGADEAGSRGRCGFASRRCGLYSDTLASPGADVAAVSPVPAQMWAGVNPSPGADVGGGEPQSRRRCGRR